MPLYVSDFLVDTLDLRAEETGCYMLILMIAWRRGGTIPNDMAWLKRALSSCASDMHGNRFNRIVPPLLERYFYKDSDGNFRNKRLEKELEKAEKISGKQKENAEKRWRNRKENNKITNAIAMPSQSQSQSHTSSLRSDVNAQKRVTISQKSAADFNRFWEVWPNKVGKLEASKAFFRVRSECEAIIAAVPRYVVETQAAGRPWLNPATFLNQRRWEDSPAPQPMARASPPPSNRNGFAALARKLYGNGDELGTIFETKRPDAPVLLLSVNGDGGPGAGGADAELLPRKAGAGSGWSG
jgi:uncharacterized protein YdaU (DUF1376 family)